MLIGTSMPAAFTGDGAEDQGAEESRKKSFRDAEHRPF